MFFYLNSNFVVLKTLKVLLLRGEVLVYSKKYKTNICYLLLLFFFNSKIILQTIINSFIFYNIVLLLQRKKVILYNFIKAVYYI